MYLADRMATFIAFLRAGYPTCMPTTGYIPLAALLPRRLCDDEIRAITNDLIARRRWRINIADIAVEITRITNEMPLRDDIERVQRRLDTIGHAPG